MLHANDSNERLTAHSWNRIRYNQIVALDKLLPDNKKGKAGFKTAAPAAAVSLTSQPATESVPTRVAAPAAPTEAAPPPASTDVAAVKTTRLSSAQKGQYPCEMHWRNA